LHGVVDCPRNEIPSYYINYGLFLQWVVDTSRALGVDAKPPQTTSSLLYLQVFVSFSGEKKDKNHDLWASVGL
jgi:hypothetical protein